MSRPAKDLPALRPGDHLAAAGGFKKRGLPLPALWPKHKGNPGNRKPPGHPSFSLVCAFGRDCTSTVNASRGSGPQPLSGRERATGEPLSPTLNVPHRPALPDSVGQIGRTVDLWPAGVADHGPRSSSSSEEAVL
jgi:hypothetical protein